MIIRRFFSFCNIFFYTKQAFVFHLLVVFCIVHDHIVPFISFSFSERLWYLSRVFLWSFFIVLIIIFNLCIFRQFHKCKKKTIKKILEDIKIQQVSFIMIYIIHKISVLLKITRILKRFLRDIIDFYIF